MQHWLQVSSILTAGSEHDSIYGSASASEARYCLGCVSPKQDCSCQYCNSIAASPENYGSSSAATLPVLIGPAFDSAEALPAS